MIGYVNIEGLSRVKIAEMEELILSGNVDFLVLAKTHCRGRRFEWQEGIRIFEVQRKMTDKWGWRAYVCNERLKRKSKSMDIIEVEISQGKHVWNVVGTYWDVKDKERNEKIAEELKRIVERREKVVVVGDFNAHLEEIDGRKNWNGEKFRELLEEGRLINVNTTERCRGQYTWVRGDTRTTIDYVLADDKAWEKIKKMEVDEEKDVDVKTGHSFIKVWVRWNDKYMRNKKELGVTKRFYSKKEDDLVEFARRCEEELRNLEEVDLKIEQVEETMIKVAESCLKREVTVVKRNRVKSNSREVDRLIKERRELNKMRRKEADMGTREDLWKKYLKKKRKCKRWWTCF